MTCLPHALESILSSILSSIPGRAPSGGGFSRTRQLGLPRPRTAALIGREADGRGGLD